MDLVKTLAGEFETREDYVRNILALIDEGNTIPFIARYRKEQTGSMDDQLLRRMDERLTYLRGLEKRKAEVSSSIEEQGKLTDELRAALAGAATLAQVEDLYRPYKPKRKTRASVARERGLEGLATLLFAQAGGPPALEAAQSYVNPEKEVPTAQDALAGALDIIAEDLSDDARLRGLLRGFTLHTGKVTSKAAIKDDSVYAQYYDFAQALAKIADHQVLALDRGEREKALKVSIEVEPEKAIDIVTNAFVKNDSEYGRLVAQAAADAYTRLIAPSLERELRAGLTERAAEGAIHLFSENLRQLLLAPPIKGKVALGMDPGYRMGCKLAVVDATGKVLATETVYEA